MDHRRPLTRWAIGALLLASAGAAADALDDDATISSPELVREVLERNAGIQALTAAAQSAHLRSTTAGKLDDPAFSYGFAPRTFGREGQGLNQRIEISQSIPWPGTLDAREHGATSRALIAANEVEVLRLSLEADTKQAFAEWYYIGRSREIHDSTHELIVELIQIARTRYTAGLALRQDALLAEVEAGDLDRHGLTLRRLETSIRARINGLLNRPAHAHLPRAANVPFSRVLPALAQLEAQTLQRNPQLRRAEHEVAAREAAATLAEKAFYPDLRFSAGYNSLWDEADKRPIVGIAINLPLDRGKRRTDLDRAKSTLREAQLELLDRRSRLLAELASAYAAVEESIDAVALYETSLLPLSADYRDAAVADYQSGAGDFISVIEAERRRFETEESLVRGRADYFRHLAELERLAGAALFLRQQEGRDEH